MIIPRDDSSSEPLIARDSYLAEDAESGYEDEQRTDFVAVDLRSFQAGRPPLVDLYHLLSGQHILYCEAMSDFTESARLRLLKNDVTELFVRFAGGRLCAGALNLPDILGLPDSRVPPAH